MFVKSMLSHDPTKRPTTRQILDVLKEIRPQRLSWPAITVYQSINQSINLFVQRTGQKGPWGTDNCPKYIKNILNTTTYSSQVSTCLAVACLTAVREVLGSNRAVGSCVYRTTTLIYIYSLGHGLSACAPFLQCLGQLSLLPSVGRTVNAYKLFGLSNNNKW